MDEKKIQQLDDATVQASKKIKVLNALSWPADAEEKFLHGWRKGNAGLPEISLAIPDVAASISQLESVVAQCDENDPVEKFLLETAQSYATAGRMLTAIGTPDFTH